MPEVKYVCKQWLFLLESALRMMQEDPAALYNNLLEKIRLRAGLVTLDKLISRIKISRSVLEGDEEYRRGEITQAINLYRSAQGLKKRTGQRFANRLEQQKFQLKQEIIPCSDKQVPESDYFRQQNGGTVLWFLNNSLPFTKSGYTYRTHSSLKAIQSFGLSVQGITRLGYPVVIGSISSSPVSTVEGVRYHRLIPIRYPSTLAARNELAIEMLATRARDLNARILHTTTDFKNAQIVSRVARELEVPWVYEVRGELENTWLSKVQDDERETANRSEYYRLAQTRETEAMKAASAVVVLSEVSKANLVARGVKDSKIFVVPNAIDERDLDRDFDVSDIRIKLGLSTDSKWFGSVTSVVGYEGLDLAIQALTQLGKSWNLLIVGDGTDLPRLRNLAEELGVENRVRFAGHQGNADIWRWYAALDVFVIPRIDAQVCRNVTPLKPLLAKALGVPTVCSDLPALREVAGAGGLFFPPGDLSRFVQQIEQAMGNEELTRLGKRWVKGRTWKANASRYREIYTYLEGNGLQSCGQAKTE